MLLVLYVLLFETVKLIKLIFVQQKDNQVITADHYFFRRKLQLWEIKENLEH